MRNWIAVLFTALMVIYVVYRAAVTALFLPLTAPPWSPTGLYFVSLVLAAIASLVFSSRGSKVLSAWLAILVGLAAASFWWFVICRTIRPIWSDFGWFVIPELVFSIAGICKWIVQSPELFDSLPNSLR